MTLIQKLKIGYVKALLALRGGIIAIVQKCLFHPAVNPKKILVHRIGTFGDSIVALPAIALIREHYPNARLEFVTTYATPINLSTIVAPGIFDAVHLIDKKNRKAGLAALQTEHYDLFIDFPQNYGLIKSLRNMVIARFVLGIKSGFGWDAGMTKLFAKEQILFAPPIRETERFLVTLHRYGIHGILEFPIKQEMAESLQDAVAKLRLGTTIALVIGTNVPANMWPLTSWHELAQRLENLGYDIAVIGGEQEKERGDQIIAGLVRGINLAGHFSIAQSAAFLSTCRIAVCHDTGAMHLAYAVGTPVVALFSPRQLSSKWYPPHERGSVIQKMVECAGCFRKECDDNICMKQISIDEVMVMIQAYVSKDIE